MFLRNTIIALALLITLNAQAGVSFSNSRIFIDDKNSKQDFLLFNRGETSETCDISLIDYDVDINGVLTPLDADQKSENSAKPYVRFSPKRMIMQPQQTQKVKIIARGYKSAQTNELHSYLSISCKESTTSASNATVPDQSNSQYKAAQIIPTFVNRIPIIIRKKQVPVNIDFSNIKFSTKDDFTFVDFTLLRDGDRSIYGTFKLLDEDGKQIAIRGGVSSYVQSPATQQQLKFKSSNSQTFTLSYKEDPKFGGTESKSMVISKP